MANKVQQGRLVSMEVGSLDPAAIVCMKYDTELCVSMLLETVIGSERSHWSTQVRIDRVDTGMVFSPTQHQGIH